MFFFFNDTATTEIYTLSLHDALPISRQIGGDAKQHEIDAGEDLRSEPQREDGQNLEDHRRERRGDRSEEHTSEIPSPLPLRCRPFLLKKKKKKQRRVSIGVRLIERQH